MQKLYHFRPAVGWGGLTPRTRMQDRFSALIRAGPRPIGRVRLREARQVHGGIILGWGGLQIRPERSAQSMERYALQVATWLRPACLAA